jgi:hypothetical protein
MTMIFTIVYHDATKRVGTVGRSYDSPWRAGLKRFGMASGLLVWTAGDVRGSTCLPFEVSHHHPAFETKALRSMPLATACVALESPLAGFFEDRSDYEGNRLFSGLCSPTD